MTHLKGKKGIIMGVANNRSIATAVAEALHQQGAKLGFSYFPDETGKMKKRVSSAIEPFSPSFILPCNVTKDEDIKAFFSQAKESFEEIDFLVHSIAFASIEEIRKPTIEVSRKGFLEAMEISTYSLLSVSKVASEMMKAGGSICAMTYFGGEKVLPGYNLMGICKASLDHSIRYLANDLGEKGIRCNGISAGPIKTLASSAVGDFKEMLKINALMAPLAKNVTATDVGQSAAFLLGEHSSAITGEILHVDCGYNIMGGPSTRLKTLLQS